jgi:hypothetical protein
VQTANILIDVIIEAVRLSSTGLWATPLLQHGTKLCRKVIMAVCLVFLLA